MINRELMRKTIQDLRTKKSFVALESKLQNSENKWEKLRKIDKGILYGVEGLALAGLIAATGSEYSGGAVSEALYNTAVSTIPVSLGAMGTVGILEGIENHIMKKHIKPAEKEIEEEIKNAYILEELSDELKVDEKGKSYLEFVQQKFNEKEEAYAEDYKIEDNKKRYNKPTYREFLEYSDDDYSIQVNNASNVDNETENDLEM